MSRRGQFARKSRGLADRVRSVQFRAWFRTMLGEAYLASGALEKATAVVREALDACGKMQFVIGVGLSRQLLGGSHGHREILQKPSRNLTMPLRRSLR